MPHVLLDCFEDWLKKKDWLGRLLPEEEDEEPLLLEDSESSPTCVALGPLCRRGALIVSRGIGPRQAKSVWTRSKSPPEESHDDCWPSCAG